MHGTRSVESVSTVIDKFFQRRNLKQDKPLWILQKSPLSGLGVFAGRDIEEGEEIFKDFPIILGPRVKRTNLFCVACFEQNKLNPCSKNCGLPLCSEKCDKIHESECALIKKRRSQNVTVIDENLFGIYTPLRSFLLDANDREIVAQLKCHRGKQHGFEVDELIQNNFRFEHWEEEFLRQVCCVMDANAFEVLVGNEESFSNLKGLYPLASLMNHSCSPNTMHVFDKNHMMVVRACVRVRKGEELFHSYARMIWSTPSRIYHLSRTKHFLCRCPRCRDPTEFGSYMSSFLCKICKGNVISKNPLKLTSDYFCEDCHTAVKRSEIANTLIALGSVLRSFDTDNLDVMFKFLNGRMSQLVSPNHETLVELKYKMIWIIGYRAQYQWKDIEDHILDIKRKFCEDLLKLHETLRLGECKMKGLLLYELYLCLKEISRRAASNNTNRAENIGDDRTEIFEKARMILRDDVTAPDDFRMLNGQQ